MGFHRLHIYRLSCPIDLLCKYITVNTMKQIIIIVYGNQQHLCLGSSLVLNLKQSFNCTHMHSQKHRKPKYIVETVGGNGFYDLLRLTMLFETQTCMFSITWMVACFWVHLCVCGHQSCGLQ